MNFYDILLAKKMGGGSAPAPVLIEKTITENGIYNASDDEADGYSSVDVQVPSGQAIIDSIIDKSITSISSNVTKVGAGVFMQSALKNANFPEALVVENNAFLNSSLENIEIPKATEIQNAAFSSTPVKELIMPECTLLGNNIINYCNSIEKILMKSFNYNDNNIYFLNSNSNGVEFEFLEECLFGTKAFQNSNVKKIIFRGNTMSRAYSSAFNNTPFASGGAGGTLYVPRDLIASYQANANWNTVLTQNANNQILAIEDMQTN